MKSDLSCHSLFQSALLGAALGFAAALTYGYIFVLYGMLRVLSRILQTPVNDLYFTLAANAVAILIGSIFFAIGAGLFAALLQAVTLALLYMLSRRLNLNHSALRGAWIGLVVSLILILTVQVLFYSAGGLLVQVLWRQSYLFWWGLPGLVYIAMTTWIGWKVHFVA